MNSFIIFFCSTTRCLPVATVATSTWNHQHHNRKTANPHLRSKGTVPKAISSYLRQQKANHRDTLEASFTILAAVPIHGLEAQTRTDPVRQTVWGRKGLRRRCNRESRLWAYRLLQRCLVPSEGKIDSILFGCDFLQAMFVFCDMKWRSQQDL